MLVAKDYNRAETERIRYLVVWFNNKLHNKNRHIRTHNSNNVKNRHHLVTAELVWVPNVRLSPRGRI